MKFKIAVLTSAFVMVAATSQAGDITSPFYLPMEGKFVSETSIETNRLKGKHNASGVYEGLNIREKLGFGVSDNWMAYAEIANNFDYGDHYNNDWNMDYTIGTAYNLDIGNFKHQFGLAYKTFQPKEFFGNNVVGSSNWNKYVELNAKMGYDMDCSWMMPYIDVTGTYGLNTVEADKYAMLNAPQQGKWTYSTFAGAHMWWEETTADLGVRWENVRGGNMLLGGDDQSRDDVYLEGKFNYLYSEDMSVGVFGQYLIADSEMGNVDYGYTLGANFKVEF